MKNILNEELNSMKYLFEYKKGVVISEQVTTGTANVDLNTHRETCSKKLSLIGRQYSFMDPRGLRKETIAIKITEITYPLAQRGGLLQHKQNVAARSMQDVAVVKGTLATGGGNQTFTFTLSCQKIGRFVLTETSVTTGGIRVKDAYECPQLWNLLYNSMYVCGRVKDFKGDGKDFCKI